MQVFIFLSLLISLTLGQNDCPVIKDRFECNKTPGCYFCETTLECMAFTGEVSFKQVCPQTCQPDSKGCKLTDTGLIPIVQTEECMDPDRTSCSSNCYSCPFLYGEPKSNRNNYCFPKESFQNCVPCCAFDGQKEKCELTNACRWREALNLCDYFVNDVPAYSCDQLPVTNCEKYPACMINIKEGASGELECTAINTPINCDRNSAYCPVCSTESSDDKRIFYTEYTSKCKRPEGEDTIYVDNCKTINEKTENSSDLGYDEVARFVQCMANSDICSYCFIKGECLSKEEYTDATCNCEKQPNSTDSPSHCFTDENIHFNEIPGATSVDFSYYYYLKDDCSRMEKLQTRWSEPNRSCMDQGVPTCESLSSTEGYSCYIVACVYCPNECHSLTDPECKSNSENSSLVVIIIVVVVSVFFLGTVLLCIFLARQYFLVKKENAEALSVSSTLRPSFKAEGATELPINCPEFGLEITPAVLYFGARKAPIDVDKQLLENVIVKNTTQKKIKVRFFIPSDDDRMAMLTSNDSLTIKPGEEESLTLYITLLCTTRIDVTFPVVIESNKEPTYTLMRICLESGLSTKLDYSEIEFGERIGEGAFGTVFKGIWRGTAVAVKDFRTTIDLEASKEVMHEITLLERLRSPYIVTFYGTVINSRHNCIVMELAPLGSLALVLTQHRLDYHLKVRIALDCARGMNFLHCNHVLHRDLKTDNLLAMSLDLESPQRVKITDFGTSRMITDEAARSYTHTVGTPIYTSPEILNNQPYSEKTDVYSFGILLWSLYMQLVPYQDEFKNNFAIIKHVLGGNRPTVPPDMPTAFQTVMMRAWTHEPDERPGFAELGASLEQIDDQLSDMR